MVGSAPQLDNTKEPEKADPQAESITDMRTTRDSQTHSQPGLQTSQIYPIQRQPHTPIVDNRPARQPELQSHTGVPG